jgi:hypothetical protein
MAVGERVGHIHGERPPEAAEGLGRKSRRKPAPISQYQNPPGVTTHYWHEELETEMARIARSSRRIAFSLVFIGVMAGTGAMFGGVAGVVLALLGRTVLDMGSGIIEFMSASVLAGAAVAFLLGLYMTVKQLAPFGGRAKATAPVAAVTHAVAASESK